VELVVVSKAESNLKSVDNWIGCVNVKFFGSFVFKESVIVIISAKIAGIGNVVIAQLDAVC
jgi:hypothetical protein